MKTKRTHKLNVRASTGSTINLSIQVVPKINRLSRGKKNKIASGGIGISGEEYCDLGKR